MVIFEVGKQYANRKGNYTVIEINEPKMTVEYDDGTTADLSIDIQQRIWENIETEHQAVRARSSKSRKKKVGLGSNFYIKPTTMLTIEELSAAKKQDGVSAKGRWRNVIKRGDRLIYYAQESQVFFAVVTITGPGKDAKERGRSKESVVKYFPLDVDAYIVDLDKALLASSVELESQPEYKKLLMETDVFLEITEDEFELLAEMLTEVSEEDDEEDEDEDKEDDDFDA